MNSGLQDVFRPGPFGSSNVALQCGSSPSACRAILPASMPSAPPPPAPTFGDGGNGDLCLPLGLDTLLSNGDPLEDVKGYFKIQMSYA